VVERNFLNNIFYSNHLNSNEKYNKKVVSRLKVGHHLSAMRVI
jgi:hypothetical protein